MNKLIPSILALALLYAPAAAAETAEETQTVYERGDVNGDGAVGATDYAMLKRIVLGTFSPDEAEYSRADVTLDGEVNANDYAMLKRVVLGTYAFDGSIDVPEPPEEIKVEITPVHDPGARTVNGVIVSPAGLRAMENFGGSADAGRLTAAKLNSFKKAVGSDVDVYVLCAPLASAFYAPEQYSGAITRHQDCFYALRDALEGVKYVDALGNLSLHVAEPIYSRTDHHWNALGAYYAAQQFAKTAGLPFDGLDTFTERSASGVLGSLYGYTKDPLLAANPDVFTWYEPTRAHEVTYLSPDYASGGITGRTLFSSATGYIKFIYGDSYTTRIKTDAGTGRRLLLFKDSYGNALAPFLLSMYDEIYIADFRYFKYGAKRFIADRGITDVCFSLCAFATATGSRNYIEYVL